MCIYRTHRLYTNITLTLLENCHIEHMFRYIKLTFTNTCFPIVYIGASILTDRRYPSENSMIINFFMTLDNDNFFMTSGRLVHDQMPPDM